MTQCWAGAEQVLREALAAGARVGIIAGTCSTAEEGVVQAALTAMGDDLGSQVQVFTRSDESAAGAGQQGEPAAPSFEQSMAAATAQVPCH